mgnify:CR=1 FL=1
MTENERSYYLDNKGLHCPACHADELETMRPSGIRI